MSGTKKTCRLLKVSLTKFRGKTVWGNYDKRENGEGVSNL